MPEGKGEIHYNLRIVGLQAQIRTGNAADINLVSQNGYTVHGPVATQWYYTVLKQHVRSGINNVMGLPLSMFDSLYN
jgi:hypothetical protein